MRPRIAALVGLSLSGALLAGCTTTPGSVPAPAPPDTTSPSSADRFPALQVEVLLDDLPLPWDVAELPEGELLLTAKETGAISVFADGQLREVSTGPTGHWSSGETGLMGVAVDPRDPTRFVTCGGHEDGELNDVRVIEWTLAADRTTAQEGRTLVDGIRASSGRHGGCRVLITEDGELYVATGDAAIGSQPQDLSSLNGKVLRVDATSGEALPDNPFVDRADADPRVYSFGHRNLQGITQAADGTIWTAEHGPSVDDEVNLITAGGNYGWNPVPSGGGEGYNESVPMTDQELEGDQVDAFWSTGGETLALAGVEMITGEQWGAYADSLAVAALKAQQMIFLPVGEDGAVGEPRVPEELTEYGRLRSVVQVEDGSLIITTSDGSGDQLLRVRPAA